MGKGGALSNLFPTELGVYPTQDLRVGPFTSSSSIELKAELGQERFVGVCLEPVLDRRPTDWTQASAQCRRGVRPRRQSAARGTQPSDAHRFPFFGPSPRLSR